MPAVAPVRDQRALREPPDRRILTAARGRLQTASGPDSGGRRTAGDTVLPVHDPTGDSGRSTVEQKIVITLDAEDRREMERILIDRDEKEALKYLRERIEKKVNERTKAHCKPPFD